MSLGLAGVALFIAGMSLAVNVRNCAERYFSFAARRNITMGTSSPRTVRLVGGIIAFIAANFMLAGFSGSVSG